MDFLQNVRKENTIQSQEFKEEKLKKLELKIVEKDNQTLQNAAIFVFLFAKNIFVF